jgi:hypothetical protein
VGALTAAALTGAGQCRDHQHGGRGSDTGVDASIHVAGAILVTATSDNDARSDADTAAEEW